MFWSLFKPKCSYGVPMATGRHMDERSVDCLVLCPNNQERKVSAKSMTMCGTFFKWLQKIALKGDSNPDDYYV